MLLRIIIVPRSVKFRNYSPILRLLWKNGMLPGPQCNLSHDLFLLFFFLAGIKIHAVEVLEDFTPASIVLATSHDIQHYHVIDLWSRADLFFIDHQQNLVLPLFSKKRCLGLYIPKRTYCPPGATSRGALENPPPPDPASCGRTPIIFDQAD